MMLHVQAVFVVLLYHHAGHFNAQCFFFFQPDSCWCSCLVASGIIFFNPLFGTWCCERHVQFEVLKKKIKIFSLNPQKFLYESYSDLTFNELQGNEH